MRHSKLGIIGDITISNNRAFEAVQKNLHPVVASVARHPSLRSGRRPQGDPSLALGATKKVLGATFPTVSSRGT
jgi:hypothetical protein